MDANMIHIKAKLDNDFRRFQCVDDYATVLSTLRNLFHIPEQETFLIKFLDDEGDLCTISSQLEFEFAVAHSELLKITLFKQEAPKPKPAEAAPCLMNPKKGCLEERLAAVNAKLALPNLPPHKVENLTRRKKFLEAKLSQTAENPAAEVQMPAWKLGCGLENRLAGINAKLEQPDLPATKKEALLKRTQWLEAKLEQQKNGETPSCKGRGAHLENRLAWINAKLSQPDLPQEKVEKLTKRKEFLEAQMNNPQAADTPNDACHFKRGRCGGPGNHNLEQRLAWIKTKLEQPNLPAHKVEKLNRRKEMLEAKMEARKNGTETADAQPQQCPWTGRLEARIAMLDAKLQQQNLPDHKKEKFLAKKAWLEAKLKARQAAAAPAPTGTEMPPMTACAPHPAAHPGMPHHGFGHPHPPMYGHGAHPHHGHFGHPHHHGFGHPHGHHHGYGPHAHHGHHAHGHAHPHHGHAQGHAHGHPHHAHGHRGGFCKK